MIALVLNGLEGPITVKGKSFNGAMPAHAFLTDDVIAEVLSYVRLNFTNNSSAIRAKEVEQVRSKPMPQIVKESR